MMVSRMARWNYYFASCHAITSKGKTVELPGGHGMVTLDADAAAESVFFPAVQARFELLPGEVQRLEKSGQAERHGLVRPDYPN